MQLRVKHVHLNYKQIGKTLMHLNQTSTTLFQIESEQYPSFCGRLEGFCLLNININLGASDIAILLSKV